MGSTIISTLGVVMFIIVILEILRYFRKSNSLIVEFEELKILIFTSRLYILCVGWLGACDGTRA